ncbi:hypothetical protein NXS19_003994 [Fusarium pseudograminearum]|nr:hypothetical protein NXS19_003994 [Fusarium pseudograminearum]
MSHPTPESLPTKARAPLDSLDTQEWEKFGGSISGGYKVRRYCFIVTEDKKEAFDFWQINNANDTHGRSAISTYVIAAIPFVAQTCGSLGLVSPDQSQDSVSGY